MTVKELKEILDAFPEDLECGIIDQELGDVVTEWVNPRIGYLNPAGQEERNGQHVVVILG